MSIVCVSVYSTCIMFYLNLSHINFVSAIFFKLAKAHCELNKRIYEHDKCIAEGKTDKRDVTLQVCLIEDNE